ncbi:MAG: topoisomerase IV [Tissierellia bacterium]|nr:topoisomerase IV [Tissierellia bacterium]
MSVIHSRALPEIDGFKPAHRKLLYTMYKMGLLTGAKTKSANVVGQTMKLNPHGEGAIYATLVRLTRGNENLLFPYIDSKGNFGKVYSRDMQAAASRYTEVKLDDICKYIFQDVDRDRVDFVPNYDGSMFEPVLLPVQFPTILVNPNRGIAVGMASAIPSFPLDEISNATIALMKDKEADLSAMVLGPDFSTGGYLIKDDGVMKSIIEEGQGSLRLRGKMEISEKERRIEITEIPFTTTIEAIIQRIIQLMKEGTFKEISDIRDESDLRGLRIAIECRRGTDYEDLVQRLYRETSLEDRFNCNFNILIGGVPMQLGVRDILLNWIDFRMACIRRGIRYDIEGYNAKVHLLKGLELILLDIDKVIALIRKTPKEKEVVPALMENFNLDQTQAEYVANIRLRQINKEVIEARLKEMADLEKEIKRLEAIYKSDKKVHGVIEKELITIVKEYSKPRKTMLIEAPVEADRIQEEEEIKDIILVLTREHYIKKMDKKEYEKNLEMRIKEGDQVLNEFIGTSKGEILAFTNKADVYKVYLEEIEESKAGDLGIYVPGLLELEKGEEVIFVSFEEKFEGYMLFAFENGKVAKIDMSSYETKTKRKKLVGGYSNADKLVAIYRLRQDKDILLYRYMNQKENILLINTSLIAPKVTRTSQGSQVLKLGKHGKLTTVELNRGSKFEEYRSRTIPSSGKQHKDFI